MGPEMICAFNLHNLQIASRATLSFLSLMLQRLYPCIIAFDASEVVVIAV